MLEALRQSGAAVVCVAPGMRQDAVNAFVSERFRIYGRPVLLSPLLETADLAVLYGRIGTISPCLLAGVPMMLVPQNVEQYLISKQVEAMGAGVVLENRRRQNDFAEALGRLMSEPDYRKNAESFRAKYAGFDHAKVASLVARTIEEAMKRRIDSKDGCNRAVLH
ncbi:MAG: glycosyltransferase [Sulfuricella sp.]